MVELRADVIGQIEELSTLVGDLVDLTREDNAHGTALEEDIDLTTRSIDRSLERVRRRRNDIRFDVDAIGWQVHGDPAGLSRAILLNLLDNAAKWSPAGTAPWVCICSRSIRPAELVVSDEGPGIAPDERALVFRRFYRSAVARAMPGSGLGTAIVKQVVVKHGGMIRIGETIPDGDPPGTSFFVLLPGQPTSVVYHSSSAFSEMAAASGEVATAGQNKSAVSSVISVDSQ